MGFEPTTSRVITCSSIGIRKTVLQMISGRDVPKASFSDEWYQEFSAFAGRDSNSLATDVLPMAFAG